MTISLDITLRNTRKKQTMLWKIKILFNSKGDYNYGRERNG